MAQPKRAGHLEEMAEQTKENLDKASGNADFVLKKHFAGNVV